MLRRRGKFLALIAAGITLTFLSVACSWYFNPYRMRIAALQAAGQPVSIADLVTEPVPDDQNAMVQLERAAPKLEQFRNALWNLKTHEELTEKRLLDLTPTDLEKIAAQLDAFASLEESVARILAAPAIWLPEADLKYGLIDRGLGSAGRNDYRSLHGRPLDPEIHCGRPANLLRRRRSHRRRWRLIPSQRRWRWPLCSLCTVNAVIVTSARGDKRTTDNPDLTDRKPPERRVDSFSPCHL